MCIHSNYAQKNVTVLLFFWCRPSNGEYPKGYQGIRLGANFSHEVYYICQPGLVSDIHNASPYVEY